MISDRIKRALNLSASLCEGVDKNISWNELSLEQQEYLITKLKNMSDDKLTLVSPDKLEVRNQILDLWNKGKLKWNEVIK